MAFHTELPVYKDSYQLVLRVFEETRNFPKEYKYTLGQDMKRDALHLLHCIYRANKHQNRVEHLEVFLDELELLKLEIRLRVDMDNQAIIASSTCWHRAFDWPHETWWSIG